MLAVSKILAPIVFSGSCRGSLRYAVTLASRFGAELTIVHVLEPLTAFEIESTAALDYIEKCRRDWALDEMDKLTFPAGRRLAVKTMTLEGDAAREICSLAHHLKADLVVMPTHGHGPFRRFLLGSVTAKVLHDCDCPVWTGAHLEQTQECIGIRNVACAVDLGDQTDAVLHWTAGMASAWTAGIRVIHVVPADGVSNPAKIEAAKHEVDKRRADVGVDAATEVLAGAAIPATVCGAAKRLAADLLVIGRGHRPGGAGRLRNMAYGIIRESSCPVVSV